MAIPHFAYPISLDSSGHPVLVEQDSIDHVADQVQVALETRPEQGTPLRPGWGTPDLAFRQQPLDLEALADEVGELIPAARVLLDDDPGLLLSEVAAGVERANVYVSTGG
jgi:hypothetical protein